MFWDVCVKNHFVWINILRTGKQQHHPWSKCLQFPLRPVQCTWRSLLNVLWSITYLFSIPPCKEGNCKYHRLGQLCQRLVPIASLVSLRKAPSDTGCLCSVYCNPIERLPSKYRKCNSRLLVFPWFRYGSYGPSSYTQMRSCPLQLRAFLQSFAKFQ